jgi:hypothetical protein
MDEGDGPAGRLLKPRIARGNVRVDFRGGSEALMLGFQGAIQDSSSLSKDAVVMMEVGLTMLGCCK